jgi:hypothetical protein
MEEAEAFDPVDLGSCCTNAVMFEHLVTHEVQGFGL